jgi:hypothetical protein
VDDERYQYWSELPGPSGPAATVVRDAIDRSRGSGSAACGRPVDASMQRLDVGPVDDLWRFEALRAPR